MRRGEHPIAVFNGPYTRSQWEVFHGKVPHTETFASYGWAWTPAPCHHLPIPCYLLTDEDTAAGKESIERIGVTRLP